MNQHLIVTSPTTSPRLQSALHKPYPRKDSVITDQAYSKKRILCFETCAWSTILWSSKGRFSSESIESKSDFQKSLMTLGQSAVFRKRFQTKVQCIPLKNQIAQVWMLLHYRCIIIVRNHQKIALDYSGVVRMRSLQIIRPHKSMEHLTKLLLVF